MPFEQYEITATANQTVFLASVVVRDDHGKPIAINRFHGALEVHIDGVVQNQNTYNIANDGITFTTNPNLSGGERVEIFTDKSRLLYDDGNEVLLNGYQNSPSGSIISTDQRLRRVQITNPGAGYEKLLLFQWVYTLMISQDIKSMKQSQVEHQMLSVILRLEPENNRIVVKRSSSDTGIYQAGETITGSNSSTAKSLVQEKVSHGTGAKIYAWSSQIGAIEKLTISDQGNRFDADAVLDETTSFHNMLIRTPSSTLNKGVQITGSVSNATANVQSYDNTRNILKYKNLSGMFIDDEKVTFESSDSFVVLKNDPYTSRGKVSGEINEWAFLSDKGLHHLRLVTFKIVNYINHIHTSSKLVSINNYRSIVKDLVHHQVTYSLELQLSRDKSKVDKIRS